MTRRLDRLTAALADRCTIEWELIGSVVGGAAWWNDVLA